MIIQRLLLLTLFVLFQASSVLSAQGPLDWEEKAEFGVEIGGKIDITAQVFQPTSYEPFLILTSEKLSYPVLIDLGQKRVFTLKSSDVKPAGSFIHTKGIPKGKSAAKYSMKGGASTFKVNGKSISLTIRQTLVGEVPPGVILAHSPDYVIRKDSYKPKAKTIKSLKSYKKDTEVVVMFATWCSTCKIVLPQVLRVFEDAANPRFRIRYIGISQGGTEPREELERYGHDYPAVILIQNGKELDRIIGETPNPIEDVIANILR